MCVNAYMCFFSLLESEKTTGPLSKNLYKKAMAKMELIKLKKSVPPPIVSVFWEKKKNYILCYLYNYIR